MEDLQGPIYLFLSGLGHDARGRSIEMVLGLDDRQIETGHDFIQWLFPLPSQSRAQPGAPTLTGDELLAIRRDPVAIGNVQRAAERMAAFYRANDHWLRWSDHNHLRLTRIFSSLRLLVGPAAARQFYEFIMERHSAAGNPINPRSLDFWAKATEA